MKISWKLVDEVTVVVVVGEFDIMTVEVRSFVRAQAERMAGVGKNTRSASCTIQYIKLHRITQALGKR